MYLTSYDYNNYWIPIAEDERKIIIDKFNEYIEKESGVKDFLSFDKNSQKNEDESHLFVYDASAHELKFYKNQNEGKTVLYKMDCKANKKIKKVEKNKGNWLKGFEEKIRLFAIQDECNFFLLDWTSPPIHALNAKKKLDLSKCSDEEVKEYLVFFCSFLSNIDYQDSAFSYPFIIPRKIDDLEWEYAWEPFPVSARDVYPGLEIFKIKDFDNTQENNFIETESWDLSGFLTKSELKKKIESEFSSCVDGVKKVQESATNGDGEKNDRFNVVMLHNRDVFKASLSVDSKGMVQMEDDEPVSKGDRLPVPAYVISHKIHGIAMLFKQRVREFINKDEFLNRLDNFNDNDSPSGRLTNLRVKGGVDVSGVFGNKIEIRDVEFLGDIKFKDSFFKSSLKMIECKFLFGLSLKGAKIKGRMKLDGSEFYGAIIPNHDPEKKKSTVLDLEGANIEGGASISLITAFGKVCMRNMRVDKKLSIAGMHAYSRKSVKQKGKKSIDNPHLLDISYSRVDGPMDMGGRVFNDSEALKKASKCRRVVVGGDVMAEGIEARKLSANGIWIKGCLDFQGAIISGHLTIEPYRGKNDTIKPNIRKNLSINNATMNLVYFSGLFVGGNFSALGANITGRLFFRKNDNEFSRNTIKGNVDFSGVNAAGDIELSDMVVDDEVTIITGSCGRFIIKYGISEGGEYLCSRVAGVYIQGLRVVNDILFSGVEVNEKIKDGREGRGNGNAKSGIVIVSTKLGGGLRFWRENQAEMISSEFSDFDVSKLDPQSFVKKVWNVVPGDIDLRNIKTQDTVNLGRCKVGGEIKLNNAEVGGNLKVYNGSMGQNSGDVKSEAFWGECSAFNADGIKVSGNIDLRGLEVKSSLSARDVNVDGNILLCSCDDKDDDLESDGICKVSYECDRLNVRKGIIDLTGAKSSSLFFHMENVHYSDVRVCGKENFPKILLSRCHLGQLTVCGFNVKNKSRYRDVINLSAIKVEEWKSDSPRKDSEVIANLVESSKPFDARNYLEIESRLARIGEKEKADRLYFAMKKRAMAQIGDWGLLGAVNKFYYQLSRILKPFGKLSFFLGSVAKKIFVSFINWPRVVDRFNKYFSAYGTRPSLMVLWLVLPMLLVAVILSDHRNVEFNLTSDFRAIDSDVVEGSVQTGWVQYRGIGTKLDVKGYPVANEQEYRLGNVWGFTKGVGLAVSYAVPFYSGSRAEVVRARLHGNACVPFKSSPPPPAEPKCGSELPFSPHGGAMVMSIFQFIIWIFIAANLPTIIRRRE